MIEEYSLPRRGLLNPPLTIYLLAKNNGLKFTLKSLAGVLEQGLTQIILDIGSPAGGLNNSSSEYQCTAC